MVEERESDGQVSWNIISQNSEYISTLLKQATEEGRNGKVQKKFFTLQAIRDNLNYSLSKEERESLDDIEKEFFDKEKLRKKCLLFLDDRGSEDYVSSAQTIKVKRKEKEVFEEQQALVRKYFHVIMDILKTLGYFPRKENRERMSF